jgi:hypothetical protein
MYVRLAADGAAETDAVGSAAPTTDATTTRRGEYRLSMTLRVPPCPRG